MESERHTFAEALRSKEFYWFARSVWAKEASRHNEVMAWSHGGQQFQVHDAGRWYTALSKEELNWTYNNNMREQIKHEDPGCGRNTWGPRNGR